jgi:hypothetical protein
MRPKTCCFAAIAEVVHHSKIRRSTSALGHSRPGPVGRRSSHVRYAPKATVGHQNAIGRDGPKGDIATFQVRATVTAIAP